MKPLRPWLPRPNPRLFRAVRLALLWSLPLWVGVLAAACVMAEPPPPPDPYARYRPAMKPTTQAQLDDLGPVPRYDLTITLDPELTQLRGSGSILVPNTSADPWTYVVFRLYPSLEQYGGELALTSVTVDGETATFSYLAQGSAARIDLPVALLPDQEARIDLSWTLTIPNWDEDLPQAYRLFGLSQGMLNLPLFYPSLAVYQEGPVLGSGRWWLDQGTVRGDAAFNLASLFVVTATLPSDLVPVTSGTLVTSTLVTDTETGASQSRHVWVTGPNREFTILASPEYQSASTEAYGTRVVSYWLPGQEANGRRALQYAATALRVFSDKFGPYPYRDLRVAAAPLSFRGMEYPQLLELGVGLYGRYQDELELRTVHEVAHEWWYLQVHNDPVNFPWIDEGLAEYSTKIYYDALGGTATARRLQVQRWQNVITALQARGGDAPLNLPVMGYASSSQYEAVVYGKGALFYDALRQGLGDVTFEKFLQEYVQDYRYQIVGPEDILKLARKFNPTVVDRLYQEWIGDLPELSAPEPTATPPGDGS